MRVGYFIFSGMPGLLRGPIVTKGRSHGDRENFWILIKAVVLTRDCAFSSPAQLLPGHPAKQLDRLLQVAQVAWVE